MAAVSHLRQLTWRAYRRTSSTQTALLARSAGRSCQQYSTASGHAPAPPPLMQKLKADLKTAMRAKDAPRLAVLRAVMAASLNASKTASPITTDPQLVMTIRKMQKDMEAANQEFRQAGRDDLAEKNQAELDIIDEYIAGSGVQTVSGADLEEVARKAIGKAKETSEDAKKVLKESMAAARKTLEGKDYDRKDLANLIMKLVA